jgi:four helix bundle protein
LKSYKDLERYQLSYELAVKVHKFTLKLPKYEQYEEGAQLRKSSKGITSCIVEGYGRRKFKADYMRFLVYSHASCDETSLHLGFLNDTHDLFNDEINFFLEKYDELGRKINKYIQHVEKEWK